MQCIYIHNGITALKKDEIMLFAMDLEMIIPSEISQTKTSVPNMWNLKK